MPEAQIFISEKPKTKAEMIENIVNIAAGARQKAYNMSKEQTNSFKEGLTKLLEQHSEKVFIRTDGMDIITESLGEMKNILRKSNFDLAQDLKEIAEVMDKFGAPTKDKTIKELVEKATNGQPGKEAEKLTKILKKLPEKVLIGDGTGFGKTADIEQIITEEMNKKKPDFKELDKRILKEFGGNQEKVFTSEKIISQVRRMKKGLQEGLSKLPKAASKLPFNLRKKTEKSKASTPNHRNGGWSK